MNRLISKYFFYYPTTLAKGELVGYRLPFYRRFQYLAPADIKKYQIARLLAIMKFALRASPFYKGRLEQAIAMIEKGCSLADAYATVPYLTKQDIIKSAELLHTRSNLLVSAKTTGGSTGEPVRLLKNADALARERAATWRAYEWAGVSIGDRQARFWGVPHSAKDRFKARAIDIVANRLRISAFSLSESSLNKYYDELLKYKPKYLYGYASVIEALARFLLDNKLDRLPGLRSVICTSEVLTVSARQLMSEAFGVGVFNEYGCGEVGSIAHECEHGSMHLMADNLLVDVITDETSAVEGEIVVTDFYNLAMPLIKYRLGDYASLEKGQCKCGRTLPRLKGIHGRAYDLIHTLEGRTLHPEAVMYIFEGIQQETKAFKHFQAIQVDLRRFMINVVPAAGWGEHIKSQIVEQLKQNISSSIEADFNVVESIAREKSGKMRVIKSLIKTSVQ